MDQTTDTLLYRAGYETKKLTIKDDETLKTGDIESIARKIAACPQLESLTISGCGLTDEAVAPLIGPIFHHPSLTQLDFSGNNFKRPDFALPLCSVTYESVLNKNTGYYDATPRQNRRINAIDLSSNAQEFSGGYKGFLKKVFEADQLASLQLSGDPWEAYGSFHKLMDKSNNILNLECGELAYTTYFLGDDVSPETKEDFIKEVCERNRDAAEKIVERIASAHIVTRDDVDGLNQRMAAVLYLAIDQYGRKRAMEKLIDFRDKAKRDLKLDVNLDPYVTKIPELTPEPTEPAIKPVATFDPASAYDLDKIMAGVPKLSEDDAKKQIMDAFTHPLHFIDIGKEAVNAVGKASVASLHVMTATPTLEAPTRFMDKFLAKFAEAKNALNEISGGILAAALAKPSEQAAQPARNAGGWLSKPKTWSDAAALTAEAARMLGMMRPEADKMGAAVAEQLEMTHKVIGAFILIRSQLQLFQTTGEKIIGILEQELAAKALPDQTQKPFHIKSLSSRLEFLGETEKRVNEIIGAHAVHADKEQDQTQRLSVLLEQSLPLLAEEANAFALQIAAAATTAAKDPEHAGKSFDIVAAAQTIANIEELANGIVDSLKYIEQSDHQLRAHVGDLFPTHIPSPSLPENKTDAKNNMPQP